jgi:hypothetical protein
LGHKLILLAVEALYLIVFAIQHLKATLIYLLIVLLFGLSWLVPWQLTQELPGAWDVGILFIVLSSNEKAAEGLEHDQALVHFLLVQFGLVGEESIKEQDSMIC